jgi:hypothetical protein
MINLSPLKRYYSDDNNMIPIVSKERIQQPADLQNLPDVAVLYIFQNVGRCAC